MNMLPKEFLWIGDGLESVVQDILGSYGGGTTGDELEQLIRVFS